MPLASQNRGDAENLILLPGQAAQEIARRAIMLTATHSRRILIGLAGGPGCGKSTLASNIVGILNETIDGSAARLPMDGFQMSAQRLEELGLLEEKGSPSTFEARAFVDFLKMVKTATGPVGCPCYSKRLDAVVPDAFTIAGNVPIIVVEGNYLLLEDSPWNQIRDLLDFAVYLDVDKSVVAARLDKRHARNGLFSTKKRKKKVCEVELPNFDLAQASMFEADLAISLQTMD